MNKERRSKQPRQGETSSSVSRRPALGRRRERYRDVVIALCLFVIASSLYIVRIETPASIMLDEVWYVPDARDVLAYGTESDERGRTVEELRDYPKIMHPPVGKWFIAAGMGLFGDRPFGWRFLSAVFAALAVAIIYLIGYRLWRSRLLAGVAALLLMVDGLWFVHARIGMLDVYAATLTLIALWLVIEDRHARSEGNDSWWLRLGAGIVAGLALGVKWSVLPFLVVMTAAAIWWEVRRLTGERRSWDRWRATVFVGWLGLLPAAIYLATYTPWFLDGQRHVIPGCEGKQVLVAWACGQNKVFAAHLRLRTYVPPEDAAVPGSTSAPHETPGKNSTGAVESSASDRESDERLVPAHPYLSYAWSWPWIGRPVTYYYAKGSFSVTALNDPGATDGVIEVPGSAVVAGIPNPIMWWFAFWIVVPCLVWWAFRRRDEIAVLFAALFTAGYLPFLLGDIVGRQQYLFHTVPLIPILALATVHVFAQFARRGAHKGYTVGYAAVVLAAFVFFYPVLAAVPIRDGGSFGYETRMWLTADCDARYTIKAFCWKPDLSTFVPVRSAEGE